MATSNFSYYEGMNWTVDTNASMGPPPMPDYYHQTKFVCDRILFPIVCSFGIIGNILSLVVLTRREMQSATNTFLTALGVSDLLLLLVQIPAFLEFNETLAQTPKFIIAFRHYIIARYVFSNIFINCTCWITVSVTIERFISLCYLLNTKLACSIYRARVIVVLIFVVAFIFNFSKFFEYIPNSDVTQRNPLLFTPLLEKASYETFLHITQITLASIIPLFLLIIFNTFLVVFLMIHRNKMAKRMYKTGSMSNVDMMHISIVVASMVLIFILCHSIGVYVALKIAVIGRREVFKNPLYHSFKHVNNLLVMFNSSVNFLIYCAISKKFRTTFSGIFLDKILGKKTSWSYRSSVTDQSLTTKIPVMSFISHSTSSGSNKSGDNSEV